jgi:hypothetical protein
MLKRLPLSRRQRRAIRFLKSIWTLSLAFLIQLWLCGARCDDRWHELEGTSTPDC